MAIQEVFCHLLPPKILTSLIAHRCTYRAIRFAPIPHSGSALKTTFASAMQFWDCVSRSCSSGHVHHLELRMCHMLPLILLVHLHRLSVVWVRCTFQWQCLSGDASMLMQYAVILPNFHHPSSYHVLHGETTLLITHIKETTVVCAAYSKIKLVNFSNCLVRHSRLWITVITSKCLSSGKYDIRDDQICSHTRMLIRHASLGSTN